MFNVLRSMFDVPSVLPLRRHAFRRDHRAMDAIPPRILKPLDGELFKLVFGDHGSMIWASGKRMWPGR
jgi:hypothetical protein